MRKAQGGDGPAKPREIFDALKAGGFEFEAKDDNIAMIGLRNMLRKRYETFQKLSSGTYGLCAWYPDAKKKKPIVADSDDDDADENNDEVAENQTATPKGAAA